MWVKICGLSDEASVEAAIEAQADAIGFVFAPSVRNVSPARAAQLAWRARGRCALIAVTLHPDQALVDEILAVLQPDFLQSDWQDLQSLDLPASLGRLPVLRGTRSMPASLPPRLLFEGAGSGTGELADWTQAAQLARRSELVLAGGLGPGNVLQAIRAVRPFGVDVSSGVEVAPGRKSGALIAQFVQAARAVAQDAA